MNISKKILLKLVLFSVVFEDDAGWEQGRFWGVYFPVSQGELGQINREKRTWQ